MNFLATASNTMFPITLSVKCRCRFIVFMPNKPDKFGMKFWLLVDNCSKYVCNVLPYLGGIEKESRMGEKLADNVVHRLIQPFGNKGYNITCDNFFCNLKLAQGLLQRKTTMVGTLRPNCVGIPIEVRTESLQHQQSLFYWNTINKILLVKYQCKRNKSVMLLSTMHSNPSIVIDGKQKPQMIHYYNHNKCGVDSVDSMLRLYSSRCATRRWPVAVWENLLDIAVLNSWVCFKEATQTNVSRKQFLMRLIQQLIKTNNERPNNFQELTFGPIERQKCCIKLCKNKSKTVCKICHKVFCGTHCCEPIEKVNLSMCEMCAVTKV